MPRWIFHAIPTRLELGNKTILRIGRNVNEISPITTMIILSINVKSFRIFLPELFFALDRKWRNYLTSDSSRSVTEYLRNCNTRAPFRAVSVRFASPNYRRILLLRPSTPARLSGHVVAVCSTIITAIWTIHRTYTAARHYLLAIISLTETAGADLLLLLLACHRYNWTVTATTLIGCHVSQNLRRYFSTLELWNWITYAFLEPVFYLLRDEFILELLERRKIENS